MPGVHRDRDQRACGAATIASNPNVFVNNKLAAVDGNPNSHGGGSLNASNPNVFVGNISFSIKKIPQIRNSPVPCVLCQITSPFPPP